MRCRSESGRLTIWKSQCVRSTCGLPRSLQNVTAPSAALNISGLSLPNRVARLISAIGRPLLRRRQSRPRRPRSLRCQSQIVSVGGSSSGTQPRRPPQLAFAAEANAGHLVARQHELHVPIELEPDVISHPMLEPFQAPATRQEVAEAVEIHRAQHGSEAALHVAHALTDHGALAEHPAQARRAAQNSPLITRQLEPPEPELIAARREPKEAFQDRRQAFGVLRIPREMSDEEPL